MKGFTLLELLISMIIVSILAAISFPVYTSFQTRADREQAEVALLQLASHLENYYLLNNTYAGATDENMRASALSRDLSYELHVAEVSETDFVIQAIPTGAQISRDTSCGTLSLNASNMRNISGTGNVQMCWK